MKRVIRLRESCMHKLISESVKHVLNEISPELLARAYVGANVDSEDLDSSNDQTALNRNGRTVHRNTQKSRRERQMRNFRERLSNDLSKELGGRQVSISASGNGDNTSYYGDFKNGSRTAYHHYANVDGSEPADVYDDIIDNKKFGTSNMKAAKRISDLTDAMAGYHDELTGGRAYKKSFNNINDRINDVENIQKYNQDMKDYEDRVNARENEINSFNSLPWYKKIGKRPPSRITDEKPKFPDLKTGPYFMPDNTEGLIKQSERLKATRENNKSKYNSILKKK